MGMLRGVTSRLATACSVAGLVVAGAIVLRGETSPPPSAEVPGTEAASTVAGGAMTASFLALPYQADPMGTPGGAFPTPTPLQTEVECPRGEISSPAEVPVHNFYFTRGRYSGSRNSWRIDFNKADRQFLVVLNRILELDAFPCENPVSLDDPALRNFPFLYMLEVGGMGLTRAQADGLRSYLLSGGFLLIDDFWGTNDWNNLARHMEVIFPEFPIVDIPMDHLIFRIVYPIDEVLQVPCECRTGGGPEFYYESDGYQAHLRGIFDSNGRLMVAIAWNSDLGDAWEWAEQPYYPWDRSNYAFQLAFNLITYSMTN